jgi:hypothetical protein
VDLFDVVRSCVRRWYVLVPLLLVTAWYSHTIYSSAVTVYYSNAVIGFAPPSQRVDQASPGQPVSRNGLLDIGGANLVANLTALGLRQPSVVERVVAGGGLPDYSAKIFPAPPNTPPIPLIMIEETSTNPSNVTKTLELVTAETATTLAALQQQARVPDDQMAISFSVQPPRAPAGGMPSRTRSTIAIFAAGLGLSVVVTVFADVVLSRRKRKKQDRGLAPTGPGPEPAVDSGAEESVQTAGKGALDA